MSCFSKQILDYFYNIQNTGRILKPEALGRAGSKSEGTVIEFSWRVNDDIITDARFRTFGDVNAIAISSVLTSMMIGKAISDVLSISAEDILEHLQDNKPNYLYLTDLALSALANTYENYIKKYTKANPELAKTSEFADTLRENLAKIQKGENIDVEDYDLANLNNIEDKSELNPIDEKSDEESYLQNLNNYEKTLEENSIEKSLRNLLYGYSTVENGEVKEKEFATSKEEQKPKLGRGRPRRERTAEEAENELNKVIRGRGRPKKERTLEELEAEKNKVSKGRGRPKKDRTEEELEALNNKVSRGRGRPKKVKDEGEELSINISRRRGRPKKERSPEELEAIINKPSKGRGRPKKERTPEELEELANKVSKGRGRPKKERTEEELIELTNKVSKGRGRPKKERTPEELEEMASKVSKGRGRPKKQVEETSEIELKVSRKRGRPKKEKTEDELQNELSKPSRGRGRPKKTIENNELTTLKEENNIEENTLDENLSYGHNLEVEWLKNDTSETKNEELEAVANNFEADNLEEVSDENDFNIDLADNSLDNNETSTIDLNENDENKVILSQKRGRGRPKKEKSPEELEELENKVSKGRGRPKKEKTEEELEAEKNKVVRGRGRPRKDGNSVFGIVSLREETKENEFTPNVINVKNTFETDLIETSTRGRGRPKKEKTPEELEELENKVSKGRGRPKKEKTEEELEAERNKVLRGRGRPKKAIQESETESLNNELKNTIASTPDLEEDVKNESMENAQEQVESENKFGLGEKVENESESNESENLESVEEPNVEVENQNSLGSFNNDFAPKQNKYGVGVKTTTYFTTQTRTLRIEKTKHETSNDRITGSVIRRYNLDETNNKIIAHEIKNDDDNSVSEPLSEGVNNILKNGGSIEDALKALMEDDD